MLILADKTEILKVRFNKYINKFCFQAVEVDQGTAIEACLSQPGPLIVTINTATRTCLGGDNDFDWNDFAQMNQVSNYYINLGGFYTLNMSSLHKGNIKHKT